MLCRLATKQIFECMHHAAASKHHASTRMYAHLPTHIYAHLPTHAPSYLLVVIKS